MRPHVDLEGMLPPEELAALLALERLRRVRLDLVSGGDVGESGLGDSN